MTGPLLFRKLPVDVEARQVPTITPDVPVEVYLDAVQKLADWCGADTHQMLLADDQATVYDTFDVTGPHVLILTLEGPHAGLPGDWIIRGVEGEFYPCKRSIFEATYALVTAATGAELIAAERRRQVEQEGYTAEIDAAHETALAQAGIAYAQYGVASDEFGLMLTEDEVSWPWPAEYFKPSSDVVRNLVRAGALLAASVDVHLAERSER